METNKIKDTTELLLKYTEAHAELKRTLADIVRKIEIEDEKESIVSYLMASRQSYLDFEKETCDEIVKCETAIQNLINKINYYAR